MTTVGRVYRFRATHSLPGFAPPWCFQHEHDYTIEVEAPGGTDTDALDRVWDVIALDEDLNESFDPSTVEHIAEALLEQFTVASAVTVWEDRSRWGRAVRTRED